MNYDDLLLSVTTQYKLFLLALTGRYLQSITPGSLVTPMALQELQRDASQLAANFVSVTNKQIQEWSLLATDDLPQEAAISVAREFHGLQTAINGIVRKNIATALDALRFSKSDLGKTLHGAHGAMGLLVQRRIMSPEFTATDTAGRTWNAEKLYRFLVRDFFYQTSIFRDVTRLADTGHSTATVHYDTPGHEYEGLEFSLDEELPGMPTFAQIRKTVFHPNATAQVRSKDVSAEQ